MLEAALIASILLNVCLLIGRHFTRHRLKKQEWDARFWRSEHDKVREMMDLYALEKTRYISRTSFSTPSRPNASAAD